MRARSSRSLFTSTAHAVYKMAFVHLHTHSEYSLLDGANRIPELVAHVKKLGMDSLAVTDHGNMHAAWTFYEHAKAQKIRPILGFEAYLAFGPRTAREKPPGPPRPTAISSSWPGIAPAIKNLVRLTSIGFTEGFYRRPRIDKEVLAAHSEGDRLSGRLPLGRGGAPSPPGQVRGSQDERGVVQPDLRTRTASGSRSSSTGFRKSGGHGRDAAPGPGARAIGSWPPTTRTTSGARMRSRTTCCSPSAPAATWTIPSASASPDRNPTSSPKPRCGPCFPTSRKRWPTPPGWPSSASSTSRSDTSCPSSPARRVRAPTRRCSIIWPRTGAERRYGSPLPAVVRDRLAYELGVINSAGYAGYFLIVQDFIAAARERGIPVGPGRGSAAGSLVAYALGITDVCPLKFDLLFERFLNPERVSMPDIDVDFCFERRGEVIEYVRERYGRTSVGQIVTFGTMKARAAVKDVARVLRIPPGEADRITKLIPSGPAYSLPIQEAAKKVDELRELVRDNPSYQRLIRLSSRIEGISRHMSVHAAGVVIAPGPLSEYVPVCTAPTKGAGAAAEGEAIITQYEMGALEKVGMLKMDLLGLKTLTVIHDAVNMIGARHGIRPDMETLTFDDPKVYELLRQGRTAGVFQFESPLATDTLRAMKCDRFDDLVASNALLRPGPLDAGMHTVFIRRKLGQEKVTYPHPVAAGGARAHLRRDHLSGAGDADRQRARRFQPGRSRRAPEGGGQEGSGAGEPGGRQVRRARGRAGPSACDGRGAGPSDRHLRPLRVQ